MDKKLINDIANKLEEIKNETINEQEIEVPDNIRDDFYRFADAVHGLEDLIHDKDRKLKKIYRDAFNLLSELRAHLDKKYNKKWD